MLVLKGVVPTSPPGRSEIQYRGKIQTIKSRPAVPIRHLLQKIQISASTPIVPITHSRRSQCEGSVLLHHCRLASSTVICAAALSVRCSEGQTQTVQRQSSTITVAPTEGKEKSPELDDGSTNLPPRDDGDGGGGGGGGGWGWSGGFFFFALLAFLACLKDEEQKGDYREYRRKGDHRHYSRMR